MNIKDYIKEKWYMFILIIISFIFILSIYILDKDLKSNSNAGYILAGTVLFLIVYIIIDFLVINSRAKNLSAFIKNGGKTNGIFDYPIDKTYSNEISRLANEFNKYRAKIASDSADELDFVTKWVHDAKVPISAMKLLLENDAEDSKEILEMELLSIEQNTQKVLFHIKSSSFYDDYKITEVTTKSLINTALKPFATFFAYKKISLEMDENDYKILTDSKWSGYIIAQLLSNAVKHTPINGVITITTINQNNKVTIMIKNTGQGIKSSDIKQIFNKGYTSNNRNGLASTGYGLYLSKKLADKLGHNITAESKYCEYASFSLIFINNENNIHVIKM